MPNATNQKGYEDIPIVLQFGASATSHRYVNIVFEPCRKRNVPTMPKVGNAGCKIGATEVFGQFKTKHFADSHSLLVEAEGKKILFTGDLRHDVLDFPHEAIFGGVDLIVMEAAHSKLYSEPILNILKGLNTKRMLINHIYYGMNSDEQLDFVKSELAPLYPVTATYDGFEFEI